MDQQVEKHNIFHNEVKAIGPHLAKDWGKVGTCRGVDPGREGLAYSPTLTCALGSVLRSRTVTSRPSTRNCW